MLRPARSVHPSPGFVLGIDNRPRQLGGHIIAEQTIPPFIDDTNRGFRQLQHLAQPRRNLESGQNPLQFNLHSPPEAPPKETEKY